MNKFLRKTFIERIFKWHSPDKKPLRTVKKEQLPKLPVPTLDSTLTRYLEYASVISDEPSLLETKKRTSAFAQNGGPKAQATLETIAGQEENWHNRYWLRDMYLRSRLPLVGYSNPAYVFPPRDFNTRDDVIKFVAVLAQGINSYKQMIKDRTIPLDKSTGKAGGQPICMDQYWRMFNSHREPCKGEDKQHTRLKKDGEEYFLLSRKNVMHKIATTTHDGKQLPTCALIGQITQAIEATDKTEFQGTASVGLMTAIERDRGAEIKEKLLKCDAHNTVTYSEVMKADYLVCIEPPIHPPAEDGSASAKATAEEVLLHLLHGGGTAKQTCNRWFDKTHQFVVCEDGSNGLCFEHSVAEGIVLVNMVEHVLAFIDANIKARVFDINDSKPRTPKQLTWSVSKEVSKLLEDAGAEVDQLAKDLQLQILHFEDYGKGYLKSKHVSPDATIQLTLQLAHYMTHTSLVSTYESASTRRYRYGRVDNIRAAHPQALAWVRIMTDSAAAKETKEESFRKAIEKQCKVMQENVTGYGIDNHLAALREISVTNGLETGGFFEDSTYSELLRFPLSTSQVPLRAPYTKVCYGPVVDDGYAACYNPAEGSITFMLSAFTSNYRTDLTKFKQGLIRALAEVKRLLDGMNE